MKLAPVLALQFLKIHVLITKMALKCPLTVCVAFTTHFVQKKVSQKVPHMSLDQADGMLESGTSVFAAAGLFVVSRQTVRLWVCSYQMTGTVSDLPLSGYPE